MQEYSNTFHKEFEELPPSLKQEVEDFMEFVKRKRLPATNRKPRLDWAGSMKDLRDKYTSLELQKKSLEWWGD